MLGFYLNRPLEGLTPSVRNILRLSMYQLAVMQHKPEAAVVNDAVALARKYGHAGVAGLVNAVLRAYLRVPGKVAFPSFESEPARHISLRYSHPLWLVERWVRRYGPEDAARLCRTNNQPAPTTIRANTLRCSRQQLAERLQAQGVNVAPTRLAPEGLHISQYDRVESLDAYRDGWFTVQDESSMLVGRAMAPAEGDTIVDLCGAPGGKTTHLAQLMNDTGRIITVDVHRHRLNLVRQTAERLGITSIETVLGDGEQFTLPGGLLADKVLLDAPCTGTGVLGRRADARWRRTPEELRELCELQRRLLKHAASLLKPGGVLLYSTCSLEPEENSDLIEGFLGSSPEFSACPIGPYLPESLGAGDPLAQNGHKGYIYLLPWVHGTDGFFMARLMRRKG